MALSCLMKIKLSPLILVLDALRNQRFLVSQKFVIFEDIAFAHLIERPQLFSPSDSYTRYARNYMSENLTEPSAFFQSKTLFLMFPKSTIFENLQKKCITAIKCNRRVELLKKVVALHLDSFQIKNIFYSFCFQNF